MIPRRTWGEALFHLPRRRLHWIDLLLLVGLAGLILGAVDMLHDGTLGVLAAVHGQQIEPVPLSAAVGGMKRVSNGMRSGYDAATPWRHDHPWSLV